ncbi:helix-turn-helix transcriptional regulator [Bosea sp. 685]|uniref:helix-turn-helix transcriptional regulator n=1 Tax=Bosea sp. 685 TaxID=3080057 RepID=UPI0028937D2D|nr:helix-turn-helix transcriptional regulator [Bosea sp. 685]WNJ88027.1 helix-turn-helix transcriptional regulator [Bosea sp. 685]
MTLFQSGSVLDEGCLGVIADIGRETFPASAFACLRHVAQADMFSAFVKSDAGRVDLICADGVGANHTSPVGLSLRYANEYWRRDPMMDIRVPAGESVTLRQSWSNIPDRDYRSICYLHPRVIERISTCIPRDKDVIFLNIYRREASGCFADDELERFHRVAKAVATCVGSHDRLLRLEALALKPSHAATERTLRAADPRLSVREAEVCAGILRGDAIKEIANKVSLELSSVITYKKRAFHKLNISTRRELQEIYERGLKRTPTFDE